MARNNYANYVGSTTNLRRRLLEHYSTGNIPASKFRAFQVSSLEEARELEDQLIAELQPRYNVLGWW